MARYIDAAALQAKILGLTITENTLQYANAVSMIIADAPTIDSAPQWISVKDRLPEDRKQRVLVSLADECVYGNEQIDTDRCSAGIWVRYGENVTHWMPLPEPPKEGT